MPQLLQEVAAWLVGANYNYEYISQKIEVKDSFFFRGKQIAYTIVVGEEKNKLIFSTDLVPKSEIPDDYSTSDLLNRIAHTFQLTNRNIELEGTEDDDNLSVRWEVPVETSANEILGVIFTTFRGTISSFFYSLSESQPSILSYPDRQYLDPSQFVFLSYSHEDHENMLEIAHLLTHRGFAVWFDKERLSPGSAYWSIQLSSAIEDAGCMVVILTPASKQSEWVNREILYASTQGIPVTPLLIEGDIRTSIPISLIDRIWIDAVEDSHWESTLAETVSDYIEQRMQDQDERNQ